MFVRVVSVVVVLVLSVVPTFGQGFATAEFNGSVVDQSGAVLPGAAVTLTEESTGLVREAVSNDTGRFVIPAVPPGVYTVRAMLSGFQTQARTGIRILVGQVLTLTLTMPIGTLTDQVTVTGEAPLIEVTQTTLGSNMTTEDIENLPTQGREMLSLMQLIPGMTPQLEAGNFEGTTYSVNGRESQSSLFLVDGIHNKDDRGGAFTQVSMTIDAFAEYNVLAHDYGAEYGGASGAIVNAVTKSGTNQFRGSGYYYGQDDRFNATNYFTKLDGREKPESGNDIVGASIGGPILRNKAFFFFNTERQWLKDALNLQYPAEAAPLATSYADVYDVNLTKYFARLDYQATPNHNFGFRTIWNPNTGIGEIAEDEGSLQENFRYERAKETINSASWTAVFSNRLLNELKVSSTVEHLRQAARDLYNEDFNNDPFDPETHEIIGLNGMDPLDFGSQQQHPTYRAGPRAGTAAHYWNTIAVTEQVTFTPGNHTFKFGFGASSNGGTTFTAPAGTGGPFGQFNFLTDVNFDPANASTYPSRFRIRLGDSFFDVDDWRTNAYVADKWRVTDKLTLNLGMRYDYSDIVPETKDAFAPRLGVAYAASERLVFRGGVGKFYEPARNQFMYEVLGNSVISTAYSFDTGNDRSSQQGRRPAHVCLNPVGDGEGRAEISPACRAFLVDLRTRNANGQVFNDVITLRGDPRLGYLWSWSAGMERQLIPNVALSRLRRQRRVRSNRQDRHQRRADRRQRRGDPAGRQRVRPDGHADSGGRARCEFPARVAVSDARRVRHRLPRAGAGPGEAVCQPLGRARQLHVVPLTRCQRADGERQRHLGSPGQRRLGRNERAQRTGRLRPDEPRQPPRVHRRRQLGCRPGPRRRRDVCVLHGQSRERARRRRREQRPRRLRPADSRPRRCHDADPVGARRQRLRHPQHDAGPFRLHDVESAGGVRAPARCRGAKARIVLGAVQRDESQQFRQPSE
jgi:hypothetical protein